MSQALKSPNKNTQPFIQLLEIIHRLRAPGGCPWDRKQTPESLKAYIVEDSYEVRDAIDNGQPDDICEELGDLLLQVLLQSEIAAEKGQFTIVDVIEGLSAKLVYRHPHVFGDTQVDGADEVLTNWEKLKKEEKGRKRLFDGLPRELPGLLRAARTGEKAARVGFDWPGPDEVRKKVMEELGELDEAIAADDQEARQSELGDLLFAVAQWARHLGVQPEESLRAGCRRFEDRFYKMEHVATGNGQEIKDLDLDAMEQIWQQVKEAE
jgi:tetrapyrrole methylase family protein/MazG family protein